MSSASQAEVAEAVSALLREVVNGRACHEFPGFAGEIILKLYQKRQGVS